MKQKRQYGKNPQPPKKALSSFLLYRAEVFDKVKASNPGLRITELTLLISQMWAKQSLQTKERLRHEHQKNKIITAYEKEEYEREYGHVEKRKRQKRKKKVMRNMSAMGGMGGGMGGPRGMVGMGGYVDDGF